MQFRAAFLGAVVIFCLGWAGVLALLLRRASASVDASSAPALLQRRTTPPAGLFQAAQNAAAQGAGAAAAQQKPAVRARAHQVEHDDVSVAGTVRHLLRATVPAGLSGEALRRCIDAALDDERMAHPQVDAVSVYLYEEQVYARYTGRATPLATAVAFGVWAPGGEWQNPGRAVSGLDNRATYSLPRR